MVLVKSVSSVESAYPRCTPTMLAVVPIVCCCCSLLVWLTGIFIGRHESIEHYLKDDTNRCFTVTAQAPTRRSSFLHRFDCVPRARTPPGSRLSTRTVDHASREGSRRQARMEVISPVADSSRSCFHDDGLCALLDGIASITGRSRR